MSEWLRPTYQFQLNSANQIGAALDDIRKTSLVDDDSDDEDGLISIELAITCEIIEQVEAAICRDPRLMTNRVLDALAALSESNTFQPCPAQTLAKRALRSLASMNFYLPAENDRVISRLEAIALSATDEDIAIEAVKLLHVTAPAGPDRALPIAALHRIAKNSENCFVRIEARNVLIALDMEIDPRRRSMTGPA